MPPTRPLSPSTCPCPHSTETSTARPIPAGVHAARPCHKRHGRAAESAQHPVVPADSGHTRTPLCSLSLRLDTQTPADTLASPRSTRSRRDRLRRPPLPHGHALLPTDVDHHLPRHDAPETRTDTLNRTPPSPTLELSCSPILTVVIRDLPRHPVSAIYSGLPSSNSAPHHHPLSPSTVRNHFLLHITPSVTGIEAPTAAGVDQAKLEEQATPGDATATRCFPYFLYADPRRPRPRRTPG